MADIEFTFPELLRVADPKTGAPTKEFLMFLNQLWLRTGGVNDDLSSIASLMAMGARERQEPSVSEETDLSFTSQAVIDQSIHLDMPVPGNYDQQDITQCLPGPSPAERDTASMDWLQFMQRNNPAIHTRLSTIIGLEKTIEIDDTDSPYTVKPLRAILIADTTNADVEFDLPTPRPGQLYIFGKADSSANNLTVNASFFGGATSLSLTGSGTAWIMIGTSNGYLIVSYI